MEELSRGLLDTVLIGRDEDSELDVFTPGDRDLGGDPGQPSAGGEAVKERRAPQMRLKEAPPGPSGIQQRQVSLPQETVQPNLVVVAPPSAI